MEGSRKRNHTLCDFIMENVKNLEVESDHFLKVSYNYLGIIKEYL